VDRVGKQRSGEKRNFKKKPISGERGMRVIANAGGERGPRNGGWGRGELNHI